MPKLGVNSRYEHTFADEDSIGWAKNAAFKIRARTHIEGKLLRLSRLRLMSMSWRVKSQNSSAARRA